MSFIQVELGKVCSFENGDRGRNYPSKSDFQSEGVPFVNAGDLKDFAIDCSSLNYISEQHFDRLSNGKIRKNDILFCLRGSLGKFAVARNLSKGAIASSLVLIRPSDKLSLNYLVHYLRSSLCAREIGRFKNGAAQPNLSARDLKQFHIPLAGIAEQNRIAAILDKADAIRCKREQAIDLADDFLHSVFLELFGDPMPNSKGWEVYRLGRFVDSYIGGASIKPSELAAEGFPVFHKGAVKPYGLIEIDPRKKSFLAQENADKYSRAVVDAQYVGVTLRDLVPRGPTIGMAASIANGEHDKYVLAQGAYGLLLNQDELLPDYLVWLTNMPSFRHEIRRVAVGSTQIHVRITDYMELKIPRPDMDLQQRFAGIVKQRNTLLAKLAASDRKCEKLVNSCSSCGFGGRLDQL